MKSRSIATSSLALTLAAAITLTPMRGAFAADGDANITVWTKNGDVYRGEIVERVSGDHITIKLATGETKRIEWKDVERDSMAAKAAGDDRKSDESKSDETSDESKNGESPKEKATKPKPRKAVAEKDEHEDWPRVRIDGDSDVELQRNVGVSESGRLTAMHYEIVCRAPCNIAVEPGAGYRLHQSGHRSTDTFAISGDSTLKPNLKSNGAYAAGWVFLGLGVTAVVTGLAIYVTDNAASGSTSYSSSGYGSSKPADASGNNTGTGVMIAGVVVAVLGIVLLASSSSSVEISPGTTSARTSKSGFALTPTGFVF
jgi:hypothetical protein